MEKQRIEYLDNLRVIAIFAIILVHTSLLWMKPEVMGINIHFLFTNIGRLGITLFLLISGALLLNKDYPDIPSFYKRRFPRIILPFIFWILISAILNAYLKCYNPWHIFYYLIVNRNFAWYFYLIIGVYLAIPFINEFFKNRELEEVKYFVIIFIFSSIFYSICKIFEINSFLDLRFFLGGLSYLVVGYYLANVEIKSPNKAMVLSIILFFICLYVRYKYQITFLVYSNHEINLNSFLDMSIFQLGICSSIFMLFRSLESKNINSLFKIFKNTLNNEKIKKIILSISMASYGMYLSHYLIIDSFGQYLATIPNTGKEVVFVLLLFTLAVFFISWILTVIVNKLPYLKIFSGYH